MRTSLSRSLSVVSVLAGLACLTVPAVAKPKIFSKSDDAKEDGAPQKFLPDYDKLVEGSDSADWVYLPNGSIKTVKSIMVREFSSNNEKDHGRDAKHAAESGKEYMVQWLKKEGFNVVEKDAEVVVDGNVFDAWEPTGGARFWGGWMANPGCGLEVLAKDSGGKIVAEIRHKARGSTIKDAVENGLEEIAKALTKGK